MQSVVMFVKDKHLLRLGFKWQRSCIPEAVFLFGEFLFLRRITNQTKTPSSGSRRGDTQVHKPATQQISLQIWPSGSQRKNAEQRPNVCSSGNYITVLLCWAKASHMASSECSAWNRTNGDSLRTSLDPDLRTFETALCEVTLSAKQWCDSLKLNR